MKNDGQITLRTCYSCWRRPNAHNPSDVRQLVLHLHIGTYFAPFTLIGQIRMVKRRVERSRGNSHLLAKRWLTGDETICRHAFRKQFYFCSFHQRYGFHFGNENIASIPCVRILDNDFSQFWVESSVENGKFFSSVSLFIYLEKLGSKCGRDFSKQIVVFMATNTHRIARGTPIDTRSP